MQTRGSNTDPAGPRRLTKAREGLLIDGVAAGTADYLGVGRTPVRIAFVVLGLAGFWGALLYLLGMVCIPRSPAGVEGVERAERESAPGVWTYVGYGVLLLGILIFLSEIHVLQWRFWRVWRIGFHAAWPLFVVALGAIVLDRERAPAPRDAGDAAAALVRPEDDRMVAGVCAALGRRWRVDPAVVRVLWSFLTVVSWGVGALTYGLLALFLPGEAPARGAEGPVEGMRAPEKMDPPEANGPAGDPGGGSPPAPESGEDDESDTPETPRP